MSIEEKLKIISMLIDKKKFKTKDINLLRESIKEILEK